MKTLFLSLQGVSPVFQAMEAELIQLRQEKGEEVWVIECAEALLSCRFNTTHNLVGCAMCLARCSNVMDQLGIPAERRRKLDPALFPDRLDQPLPEDLRDLIDYTVEGVTVGRGAASTTISFLRDYDLQTRGEHQELMELQIRNAIGAARNYRKILEEVKPDEVIVLNGRHVQSYPMVDLCEKMGIPFNTFEAGARFRGYQLFENSLPHSIKSRNAIIDGMWAAADPESRAAEAAGWFEQKRKRTNTEDKVYTADQNYGLLPKNFDPANHNIVIFNSSEDEMKTIVEWRTDLFQHQNDAIRQVMAAARSRPGVNVFLRVHPNLAGLKNRQMKEIGTFPEADITVIPATSKVDSYELADAADVVLTFGSSIGIEATYWRTPSVLYGHSFYEALDAVYQPQSQAGLMELLFRTDLEPKPRENALPYGLFVNNFGTPYRKVRVESEHEAYVGGRKLEKLSGRMVVNLLKLAPNLPKWLKAHRLFMGRGLRPADFTGLHNRKPLE